MTPWSLPVRYTFLSPWSKDRNTVDDLQKATELERNRIGLKPALPAAQFLGGLHCHSLRGDGLFCLHESLWGWFLSQGSCFSVLENCWWILYLYILDLMESNPKLSTRFLTLNWYCESSQGNNWPADTLKYTHSFHTLHYMFALFPLKGMLIFFLSTKKKKTKNLSPFSSKAAASINLHVSFFKKKLKHICHIYYAPSMPT